MIVCLTVCAAMSSNEKYGRMLALGILEIAADAVERWQVSGTRLMR